MRFHFHASFITVILGATLFGPEISVQLIPKLLLCYLIFNVLIYGGLYTFNDIIDLKADSEHPIKKFRPIASGEVSVKSAAISCASLIITGLIAAILCFPGEIYQLFFLFILLNFGYTLFFKKMIYLNIAIVGCTHTLRLVLGMTIAKANIDPAVIAAFYCMLFGLGITIHSMFNFKPYEIPYYTPKKVLIFQTFTLLCSTLFLTIAESGINIPIAVCCFGFFILALCSKFEYFHPIIAKIFMIKTKVKK